MLVTVKREITLRDFENIEVEGENQIIVPAGTKGTIEPGIGEVMEVMFPDGPLYFDRIAANFFLDIQD